jgi:hypothetical protein
MRGARLRGNALRPLRSLRGSIADALGSRTCQDLEPMTTPSECFWSQRTALNFAGERLCEPLVLARARALIIGTRTEEAG